MANFFYYDENGTKQGLITPQEMKTLAKNGTVTPETIVENEQGQRGKAKQIKGLTFPKPELVVEDTDDFGVLDFLATPDHSTNVITPVAKTVDSQVFRESHFTYDWNEKERLRRESNSKAMTIGCLGSIIGLVLLVGFFVFAPTFGQSYVSTVCCWIFLSASLIVMLRAAWQSSKIRKEYAKYEKEFYEKQEKETARLDSICPKCQREWARKLDYRELIGSKQRLENKTTYKTAMTEVYHKDIWGKPTGERETSFTYVPVVEQHLITDETYEYTYKCKFCGHTWIDTKIEDDGDIDEQLRRLHLDIVAQSRCADVN
jgi:hypothetical protein